MAVRCPGLVAAKQAKIKTIPPPCLKVVWGVCARGADVLWLVFANNALCIMTKHHHFCLICPKDVTPQVLWLIYKSSPCCHVQEKGRPPGQPSYLQGEFFLFRPFLIVQSWTLKLNSSRVWDIALRFLWYCVNTHVNAPDECTHKILFL